MGHTTVIPARMNSSRFPGKALKSVGGIPLIVRALTSASASHIPVWVATDDDSIYDEVKKVGAQAIITSKNHKSGTDRVAEVARKLSLSSDDVVINIQGDQPLVPSDIPSRLIDLLLSNPEYHMATVIVDRLMTEDELADENCVKALLDKNNLSMACYFFRNPVGWSQIMNSYLRKHVGIYAYRNSFLQEFSQLPQSLGERINKLEQLRALDNNFQIVCLKVAEDIFDVNVPEDILLVERWLMTKETG